MDKVIDNLYVGDANDANNPKVLEENNIEYILNLSRAEAGTEPDQGIIEDKTYFRIPLSDDGNNNDFTIESAIKIGSDLVKLAREEDEAVLLNCSVGLSRSVAIAGALMSLDNVKVVQENINRIKQVRTGANPHPELVKQVSRITREIHEQD